MIITVLAFLVTLGVLVSFHELGHYLAARSCGVRVLQFSIGFGKPLFKWIDRNKTEWMVAAIPLGGFVKLVNGRDPNQHISKEDRPHSFDVKPLWQRSWIVAAGPLANFLLAILLLSLIYISGVPQLPARLQAPIESSLAAKLGVMAGDTVNEWKAEGDDTFEEVISWNALRWLLLDALTAEKGFSLQLTSVSGGNYGIDFPAERLPKMDPDTDPMKQLGIFPELKTSNTQNGSGVNVIESFELQLDPVSAFFYATERVRLITKVSARMMLGLITGKTSFKQLSGPISIADMAGKTAQFGWQPFISFLSLLSISVGLLNLLPLPMLDGGQLMYDAWEMVSGKRIPQTLEELFQKFGFVLIIALTMLALFNDLQRYLLS